MSMQTMLPSLIFMTLFAGLGFALVQFLASLQRRSNRVAASDTLVGHDSRGPVPDGALPELLSVVGVAVIAMGLLTTGYMWSGRSAASVADMPSATTTGTAASPTTPMTNPSQPRANPADKPNLPTSATSPGSGG